MEAQLVAIATDDSGQVAPHAGRAQLWHVYRVSPGDSHPELAWEIRLTDTGCLHEWHVSNSPERHPLHAVDTAIAGSAGDGVIGRLAERGTDLVTTAERAPLKALTDYLEGILAQGVPHEEQPCLNPQQRAERMT
ncbi:NifB/NifX family molybdenum-iron cluster-binding protein [Marinobacterium sp. YM272]|uniref:NifB/NifX family molybdenum-iron cluster-binding protein n=1 Tax=Marinobacterium sp. YM272 TaxID=3421654 RepID=UPI003D80002F